MMGPTYWLSIIAWLGVVGTSTYILFLYISPIVNGFTSAEAAAENPPRYCDRVIGQSGRWNVPTTDSSLCDQVIYQWPRGAASTGIGIGIVMVCLMFGSCLKAGNKMVIARMTAQQIQKNNEINRYGLRSSQPS